MERHTASNEPFIPEPGAMVELTGSIDADAKSHLSEFPTEIEGKYTSHVARLEKGEWYAFVGPYRKEKSTERFNPNHFPYHDGPFQGVIKVPIDAVKPVDTQHSATILPFRKP